MVCIADTKQTLALEAKAIKEQKISIKELMEKAGKALADEVKAIKPKGSIVVVCGKGNNAGDGFVAARHLDEAGLNVNVLALYDESKLKGDASEAFKKVPKKILIDGAKDTSVINKAEVIVDAIFGFSFKPPVKHYELDVIKKINAQKAVVISADVPSGLEATTGEGKESEAVKADETICFSCIKKGLLTNKGPLFAGHIKVVNIGIDKKISDQFALANSLDRKLLAESLPKRSPLAHKKNSGRVLVVAGSLEYTGAPVMTSEAAYRSGAGFVTLVVPGKAKELLQQKILPEVIVGGIGENKEGVFTKSASGSIATLSKDFDCIALGPGLSNNAKALKFARKLLTKVEKPVVVDADGLNALAKKKKVFEKIKTKIVLTPQSAELARLLESKPEQIEIDRFDSVQKLASDKITVVLKGRYTLTAGNGKIFVNLNSNPGMATAGTGDILTGIIAALIAQGAKPPEAAKLGVYLHGLAGDIAASELGEHSLLATDLLDTLPYAFKTTLAGD